MLVRLFRSLPPWAAHLLERLARTAPFRRGPLRALVVAGKGALLSGEVTIRHGPAAGMRFVADDSKVGFTLGTEEPEVQAELARVLRPGSVLYDVGANVGFMALVGARLVGPTGHVYAFEPNPENARALERNVALNGLEHVTVLELALAEREGSATLHVPEEHSGARLEDVVPHAYAQQLEVPLKTVDGLLERGEIAPPDVVKLDVEGAELLVLEGMRATLARHGPALVVELHDTRPAFEALLRELGYAITGGTHDSARDAGNDHVFARRAAQ